MPTSLKDSHTERRRQLGHGRRGEKWIAGLNDMKTLYDMGFFPDNTLTASDPETVQLFADDEAAFLIDGSWKVGHFG